MKTEERQNLLNRRALAKALGLSETTLWRVIKSNQEIARQNKLRKCPTHRNYAGGRKHYLVDEVQSWLDYINKFSLKKHC
ncbi:hypothetical protein [Lactobacillus huangpiensis]|uniref:hypothetical protein n=1 Tax=Lactobacillus huangpiensis TaxID=2799571 RepID=UPI001CC3C0D2|nr:hypothetical protein [Lactobacillus huangpiensis]